MYRYIGTLLKQHPHLSAYILTSNKEFEYLVNRKATKDVSCSTVILNVRTISIVKQSSKN